MMREANMKAALVDFLLPNINSEGSLLGCEVPYAGQRRRADIVLIGNEYTHAYEVKTDFDSFDRLDGQLNDSFLTFNYTHIVVSQSLVTRVRKRIRPEVGIISVDPDTRFVKEVRKPTKRTRLNKFFVSTFLWRSDLLALLTEQRIKFNRRSDTHELREQVASSIRQDVLNRFAIRCLRFRYRKRYLSFLVERGKVTHPDDLRVLTIEKELIYDSI